MQENSGCLVSCIEGKVLFIQAAIFWYTHVLNAGIYCLTLHISVVYINKIF